jgi:beta-phosphoglucomutase-like phosphatase (HAD superfamily)
MRHNECPEFLRGHPASLRVVFLDDGGVLNDNGRRGPEYLRLLGEYLPSRLGGVAGQWEAANRSVVPPLWTDMQSRIGTFASHADFQREYELRWLGGMCAHVGVPTPPAEVAVAMARDAAVHVARHARAAIDGAAAAVRRLRGAGYVLHTASGTPSWELEAILTRMGIRAMFETLYGPDLVDHVKHGLEYYRRVFRHAGVAPAQALVVESCRDACGWARSAGARAVRIGPATGGDGSTEEVAPALSDLADAIIGNAR